MAVATSGTEGWKTMPTPVKSGTGDMFLKVKGARTGPIKGESNDQKHKDEIEVLSWSWGMQAQPSRSGGGEATGKSSLAELKIVEEGRQGVDRPDGGAADQRAIQEAVLTVRKAGKGSSSTSRSRSSRDA